MDLSLKYPKRPFPGPDERQRGACIAFVRKAGRIRGRAAPALGGPARVGLALALVLLGAARAVADNETAKLLASDGAQGDTLGAAVALSNTTAIVGAWGDDDNGSLSGSAYLFDTTTGLEIAKLLALDGEPIDYFGAAVGISGGISIVGARGNGDSGSAYLFDSATGAQLAKLTAADAAWGDSFGWSVAVSGTRAVVGAYGDDDNGATSGSAYLFDVVTGSQIAKLLASDGASQDAFGWSVAIDGATVIVGANGDADNGISSGSAYLFDAATGVQLSKLLPGDGAAGDLFGVSVAISGSLALVGTPQDDDHGAGSGSAYLFDISNSTNPVEVAKLLPSDGMSFDFFGSSVALDGTTALVGAQYDDDVAWGAGSAYLFDATTGVQLAKLVVSDPVTDHGIGVTVALSGNGVIAGALGDDTVASNAGAAYLFEVPAPCSVSYCTPASGSANNAAVLSASGCALSGSITLDLAAAPVGQFTYLLIGNGTGRVSDPAGALGDLCLTGGTLLSRYVKDVGAISAGGTFSTNISDSLSGGSGYGIPGSGGQSIQPGETWNFQYWHRRPAGQPSGFSGALGLIFR